ncbi:MAG: metal-dependent transcriptional regulator [Planctomycetota bacterium]|nr:metal-dependent transcriptional regulator [Planctomycetota bacterium]
MGKAPQLSSAMEDYLESIRELAKTAKVVRVRDISRRQGVEAPSVTTALRGLVKCGMVTHEKYGHVELTAKGKSSARVVSGRHAVLRLFLRDVLGLSERIAEADACRMEHAVSPETMRRLTAFVRKAAK